MSPLVATSLAKRFKGGLPPSPPHPATIQTVGGRRWPYRYLELCRATCGDRFTLYPLDRMPMVFVSSPQDIRDVLTGNPAKLHPGAGGRVIAPLIGEHSFMLLEQEDHVAGRKAIQPAFHKEMVRRQAAALVDAVDRTVESWPHDTVIELQPRIRALTLGVILRIIFSDHPRQLTALQHQLMGMLAVSDTLLLQGPRLRHLPYWRGVWRRFLEQRHRVDQMLYSLIRTRRAEVDRSHHDLLDLLLDAHAADGAPLSSREIRDNLMSMILAGHETTTGEVAWTLQLLAHNPEAQSRLAAELDCDPNTDYLAATIHETMRRRPVFAFAIPRDVVAPVEIGGFTYQPGVQLVACTYLLHHNPELYARPHEFEPERFLDSRVQTRTWLPWGGGRKHCLGRHFAMFEVEALLRSVIEKCAVRPVGSRIERPRWRSAIIVPGGGCQVVLHARRRQAGGGMLTVGRKNGSKD